MPVDMDESESYRLPEDTAAGLSLHSAEVEQQQQHRSDLHQAHREQDPLTGMPAGTAAAANGIRNVADRHDARDRELVASAREPATQNTAPAALLAPAAEVSGAGDEADSQGVAVDDSELLMSVVERFLGPGIKYFRQQDLGDLWVEMLAPELRPPWGAVEVLAVLDRHSTTFWEVLSRGQLNNARSVQRTVRSWARGGRSVRSDEVRDPARKLQDIMQSLLVAMDKPGLGSQAPNPAEVPDFVSLGDARAALQRGIKEIEQLLGSYRVSRGGMGAEGSGGRCQAPERYR